MNVLAEMFSVVGVVVAFSAVAVFFFLVKVLVNIYRLKLVKKHVRDSKECITMLLTDELYVVCMNDYDKTIFPFLREEIVKCSLWDKLLTDYVVQLGKGYQDSLISKQPVTMEYSINRDDDTVRLKLVFAPAFRSYVVCYICLVP